jgi:hypothetical protein
LLSWMRLESSELRICNDILPNSSHALDGNGASTFPCFISCEFTQTWPLPPQGTTPWDVHASFSRLIYEGWARYHKYHQPCVKPPLLLYPPRFQRPCLTLHNLRLPDQLEVVNRTPNISGYYDRDTNVKFYFQIFCAAVSQTLNNKYISYHGCQGPKELQVAGRAGEGREGSWSRYGKSN